MDSPDATTSPTRPDLSGRLLFDLTSWTINSSCAPAIDDLAAYLKANPEVKIGLSGHTDRSGSTIANLAVSKARADAVRHALEAKGIAASRIRAFGYGARLPTASNSSSEGRRQNRRVDVQFFGGVEHEVSFTG